MKQLIQKVRSREAAVSVIGLGYVGLPLLLILRDLGFKATGIDKNKNKVRNLNRGRTDFLKNSPKVSKLLAKNLKKKNFHITDEFSDVKNCDFIFITVDTPVKNNKLPDQTNITNAAIDIGRNLQKGTVVVIESTISPGTTKNLVIPTIEKFSKLKADSDFYVVVCSERIRPNQDAFTDMKQLPRVLGVSTPDIIPVVRGLYNLITKGEIDVVDTVTAEVVKTAENALRDVKIAFANEIALICENVDTSVLKVRELINKRYGREDMLMPGAGVGGHCLPKDPWLLLASANGSQFNLIPAARKVNESMPNHVVKLLTEALAIKNIDPNNALIAILGFSYIENCEDQRNSPSEILIGLLKAKKIKFKVHDPYINGRSVASINKIIAGSDCLILMVTHDEYKKLNLALLSKVMRQKIIIDGRNFFDKQEAQENGFIYKGIGNT